MENLEPSGPFSREPKSNVADEVKQFYKDDFKHIVISFFKNPIDGIYSVLEKPSEKAFSHALILFASVFFLYLVGWYVIMGDARKFLDFGDLVKMSIIPLIVMFVISILSFAIKQSVGKSVLKNELLTGGLCGIPLGLLVLVLLIIKMSASDDNIMKLMRDPMEAGIIGMLLIFYIILMFINVFQQSLKSSGAKDAVAWYLSPASVLLAFYLAFQIVKNVLY
jgi:hypothetical protein